MIPILTLIFVVGFSMLVTKIATIALTHTGMSRERARFQARSAFSGAGFTTTESEVVVKHPVRRRIITILILLGNAGLVTAISSLILGFGTSDSGPGNHRNTLILLFLGLAILFLATRSARLDHFLNRIISNALDRFTELRIRDFSKLLTVMGDYEISEMDISDNAWMVDRRLADLHLPEEGILVLGIIRGDGTYIGVPRGRYSVEKSDTLILYGKAERITALSQRKDPIAGKQKHMESVKAQEEELEEQDKKVDESKD